MKQERAKKNLINYLKLLGGPWLCNLLRSIYVPSTKPDGEVGVHVASVKSIVSFLVSIAVIASRGDPE